MVCFLCFSSPLVIYSILSKKFGRKSSEMMSLNPQESSQAKVINSDNNLSSASVEQVTSPSSHEGYWISEELNCNSCSDESKDFLQVGCLKKCQSLGSVLDKRKGFPGDDILEDDDADQEFTFDYSHEDKMKKVGYSVDNTHPVEMDTRGHESIFSIGVPNMCDVDPIFAKSCSVTNLGLDMASSTEGALAHELAGSLSKSFEDLCSLHGGRDGSLNGDGTICSETTFKRHITSHLDEEGSLFHADSVDDCVLSKTNGEPNGVVDHERDDKYSSVMFQWRYVEPNDLEIRENESSTQNWGELSPGEFNIKRIEQWISQIEIGESSHSAPKEGPKMAASVTTSKSKPDSNSPSIELPYSYNSSLTPTSSSAQMSNLGLVAIPFLSAFVGLRVLNLSNNGIVRITSGALPRGLHMLNLSKNNISTIEGLRELTRLRVLDMSYNRIVRIGHGLASCSSMKELYLAGNKIGEVDGLHRLLKLNVLDLRFNKISTAKGIGQLAANYGALLAIDLQGNPAQKNIGDDQLKKHLLSLLPHLRYYNKQAIRGSSSKEVPERPPRSIISHPPVRGMMAEQHRSRRGARGPTMHKSSSSSKISWGNYAHLPPTGGRGTNNRHSDPIRRSMSMGTI